MHDAVDEPERVGAPPRRLDNAPIVRVFHTLKVERIHHRVHATRAEA